MRRRSIARELVEAFKRVSLVGLKLPHVKAATRYDGAPVLKMRGCFMAGVATDPAAEPCTLVVRVAMEDRDALLEDAPETYYLTDYHRRYPVVLARLSRLDEDALRDLLWMSWRLTAVKAGKRGERRGVKPRPTPS